MPPLREGLFTSTPGAGELFPQPHRRVDADRVVRFDDTVAPAVTVAARHGHTEELAPAAAGIALVDIDDWIGGPEWFDRHGCHVAVIRPDRYVYGTSTTVEDAERMISELTTLFPVAARG
jgi:3-(3-hydroxy-phenyl)propionate hydroxylase